jgi:hypothetical protein
LKAKIESRNQRQKDLKAKLNAETFFRQSATELIQTVNTAHLHAVDFQPENLVAWPTRSQEDVFWVSRVSANGPDALQNSCQCLQARQAACICIATRERGLPYSSIPFSIPV